MKKIALWLLILGLLAVTLSCSGGTSPAIPTPIPTLANPDFRDMKWGMTKTQVSQAERSSAYLGKDSDHLYYSDINLQGFIVMLVYDFNDDGQAYTAMYVFPKSSSDTASFDALKGILTDKYGMPIQDKIFVDSDLTHWSQWQNESTIIDLLLQENNVENKLSLTYTSRTVLKNIPIPSGL